MELVEQKPEGALVLLSKYEIGIINNALNEVCNGIVIPEFETRSGCSLSESQELLRKVGLTHKIFPAS